MNVVYACDGNELCSKMALNSIRTLRKNNPDINCFIITNNFIIVNNLFRKEGINIIDVKELFNKFFNNLERKYSYTRLLIPLIEPFKTMDRLLYLDCDTEILKNIEQLYNIDMTEYDCCCALDNYPDNRKWLLKYLESNNLQCKNTEYFQSGVILFNIQNIIKYYTYDFLENISKLSHKKAFPIVDQGIINTFFKIKKIDIYYNCWYYNRNVKIFHAYGNNKNKNGYLDKINKIEL